MKPSDAKRWSLGLVFLYHPKTHDRFFIKIKKEHFDSEIQGLKV